MRPTNPPYHHASTGFNADQVFVELGILGLIDGYFSGFFSLLARRKTVYVAFQIIAWRTVWPMRYVLIQMAKSSFRRSHQQLVDQSPKCTFGFTASSPLTVIINATSSRLFHPHAPLPPPRILRARRPQIGAFFHRFWETNAALTRLIPD